MKKLPIARWLGEFVVIVVGVLVALGVDSWRQGRADVSREINYLQRLSEDLAVDSARFEFSRNESVARSDALRSARAVLAGTAPEPDDPPLLLEAPRWAIVDRTPTTQRNTYDELVSQGDLGRIRSEDVRSALAAYYLRMETVESTFGVRRETLLYDTDRYLMRVLPADVYAYLQGSWRWTPSSPPTGTPESVPTAATLRDAFTTVQGDQELRNLLLRAQLNQGRTAGLLADWGQASANLRARIRAELARLQD